MLHHSLACIVAPSSGLIVKTPPQQIKVSWKKKHLVILCIELYLQTIKLLLVNFFFFVALGAAHGPVQLRSRSSAKKWLRSHSPTHSGGSRSHSMSQSSRWDRLFLCKAHFLKIRMCVKGGRLGELKEHPFLVCVGNSLVHYDIVLDMRYALQCAITLYQLCF